MSTKRGYKTNDSGTYRGFSDANETTRGQWWSWGIGYFTPHCLILLQHSQQHLPDFMQHYSDLNRSSNFSQSNKSTLPFHQIEISEQIISQHQSWKFFNVNPWWPTLHRRSNRKEQSSIFARLTMRFRVDQLINRSAVRQSLMLPGLVPLEWQRR